MTPITKPWYLSRAIWLSIFTLAVSIVGLVTNAFPTTVGIGGSVLSVLNLLIRLDTTLPIQ